MKSKVQVVALLAVSLFAGRGIAQDPVTDLQEFAWMVGTWTAESELHQDHEVLGKAGTKAKITATIRWGAGKKALLTTGTMEAGGKSVESIIRIVSVDPITSAVVNYTVNDRGGLGKTHSYFHDSESPYIWRVPFNYADEGRQMTGLAVVKKLGRDSYSHHSVRITVNGADTEDFPLVTWHRK